MVVVASTMPTDQPALNSHVVLKRMKEFKSLENDICYAKATSIDGFKTKFHDANGVTNGKNDISSSLPNLASTIILLDKTKIGHIDLNICEISTSETHLNGSGLSTNCNRPNDNLGTHSYSKITRPTSNCSCNDQFSDDEDESGDDCAKENHGSENVSNLSRMINTQSTNKQSCENCVTNNTNSQELEDNQSETNNLYLDDTICDSNSINQSSVVGDLIESSKLLQVPGSEQVCVHNQTCDDNDPEQADELTRLKESPRSSPGNTLDSRTSSSLCRTDSFGRTDGSSYSSVSSLSTDVSINTTNKVDVDKEGVEEIAQEENGNEFVEVCLKNQNTYEKSATSQDSGIDVQGCQLNGAKPKKKGVTLAGFLSRNLFSRKSTKPEETSPSSAPGWKLFGKIPPKDAPLREPLEISHDYQVRKDSVTSSQSDSQLSVSPSTCSQSSLSRMVAGTPAAPQAPPGADPTTAAQSAAPVCTAAAATTRGKKCDIEVQSTTALILEQRPMGLPSKDPEEELKHKLMYQQMVEAAKKKEQKQAKQRKKQLEKQLKYEDSLTAALKIWNTEILPHWDTMQFNKKALDLWWRGIPPSIRGKVWKLAFGNDLNLTKDLYHICLNRAKERLKLIEDWCGDTDSVCSHMSGFSDHSASREASVELIQLDVSRTFPQLCIFQKGGPYHELLQGLLGAYACYRPDVGYVQGMSFIAAVLILNMEVQDAFICFANLLNRPCQIAFFRLDESLMKSYFDTYEEFFEENLPKLFSHFIKLNITPDLYIIDWMFTLYAKSLPLDVASRVWDVFARDGEEFLFRTALGVLKLYEEILMNMDFIHVAQFLTRLPEDMQSHELFRCIDTVKMCIETRRFKEVLASNRDPQAREM